MKRDLPIRSKVEIVEKMALILRYLHEGKRDLAAPLIEELKVRSIFLGETIQQDVLAFIGQVLFQYDYDPWHKVTIEVRKAADRLIEDMGFNPPH